MKAVAIQAFGGPEGLAVTDLPDPSPAAGQVLIASEAIGVGGVDAVIRRGTLGSYGFQPGFIEGLVDPGLIRTQGATALKHKRDAIAAICFVHIRRRDHNGDAFGF